MITVRHIEKFWKSRTWGKLVPELLANRPEGSARLETELHSLVAAAGLAMIRMDELQQSHTPLFGKLLRTVLCSQDPDGGWRDPATTAVCLRALRIGDGHGLAIDRGIQYLANMQKDEGAWPRVPIRRTDADGFVSAYVLFMLADDEQFRECVRFDDAVAWFERHHAALDDDARRLWQFLPGMRTLARIQKEPAMLWS